MQVLFIIIIIIIIIILFAQKAICHRQRFEEINNLVNVSKSIRVIKYAPLTS